MLTTEFQKSRFCESGACVEVAWKPNVRYYASSNEGQIDVKRLDNGMLAVFLTSNTDFYLEYTDEEWEAFKKGAAEGFFDVPVA